jgi:hypothetical protein
MIMADVLLGFLIVIGVLIMLNSYWLAGAALFPGMIDRASGQYGKPVRITALGLVIAVPVIAVGIAVLQIKNPAVRLFGSLIIGTPILAGLIGSAGMALKIGLGLAAPADEQQPWRRVLRGGIVLSFTFLLPFIGWFILLPWTIISGVGALFLACYGQRRQTSSPATGEPALPLSPTPAAS